VRDPRRRRGAASLSAQTRSCVTGANGRSHFVNGYDKSNLNDVKSTDPVITRAIMEYVAPGSSPATKVLGLSVPMFYLPLVLGALLLANTTVLIGNWAALRGAVAHPPDEEYGWLILYVGRGFSEWVCRICILLLFVSVLAIPSAAIAVSIGHLSSVVNSSFVVDPWYYGIYVHASQILRSDLPTVWILISMLGFTISLCGTAIVQLRLRRAIAREKQYREGGGG
jgi:hypothetical protein